MIERDPTLAHKRSCWLLALLGTEQEPMGWDVTAAEIDPYLPGGARVEVLADTGHFIHIERPHETAKLVLDFLKG